MEAMQDHNKLKKKMKFHSSTPVFPHLRVLFKKKRKKKMQ